MIIVVCYSLVKDSPPLKHLVLFLADLSTFFSFSHIRLLISCLLPHPTLYVLARNPSHIRLFYILLYNGAYSHFFFVIAFVGSPFPPVIVIFNDGSTRCFFLPFLSTSGFSPPCYPHAIRPVLFLLFPQRSEALH